MEKSLFSDDPRGNTIFIPDIKHNEFPFRARGVEYAPGTAPAMKVLQLIGELAAVTEELNPTLREKICNAARMMCHDIHARGGSRG
jgi:hypothetical protein